MYLSQGKIKGIYMKRLFTLIILITASISLYADAAPELIVYTMKGCGRCSYTVNYLKTNNIKFTEYSTSDAESKTRMWGLIRSSGKYKNGSVSMPVVVLKGETFFNIPDIQGFTASIPSKLSGGSSVINNSSSKPVLSDTFTDAITVRHNFHRKNHKAASLKWNQTIQKFAQQWADKIAAEDRMYHRQPNSYGENIYWISGGEVNGSSVVDSWYSEIKYYNYSKPGFSMTTGHFTQVVWAGTTELGCGKAKSKRGGTYVVCNYAPPGNYSGMYVKNVLPLSASDNSESNNSDISTESLPKSISVWTNGNSVVNQPVPGWMRKTLPIVNHYSGKDGAVYIAVYSHNRTGSIYSVGNGIYVMGLIRMKGTWNNNIAEPEGWQGKDISASEQFKKFAIHYFPACGNDGWIGGDTGGFFGR